MPPIHRPEALMQDVVYRNTQDDYLIGWTPLELGCDLLKTSLWLNDYHSWKPYSFIKSEQFLYAHDIDVDLIFVNTC